MRKSLALLLAVSLAVPAMAEERWLEYIAKVGTSAGVTNSLTLNPKGYIKEIYTQWPAGAVTAAVTVISTPNVGSGLTPTVLYTNAAATAGAKIVPRFVPTDNTGSALSSLTVAEPFLSLGDPLVFRVLQASASTGITFRCYVKVSENP